jgi:hypothetical protein
MQQRTPEAVNLCLSGALGRPQLLRYSHYALAHFESDLRRD